MVRQPAASVIIPSYNKAHVLSDTLQALEGQTLEGSEFETIVVDDGSTDNTAQLLQGYAPAFSFRFVRQENKGAGAARNLGASLAKGDILVFLDSDILLEPGALAAHLNAHEEHGRIVATSRILPLSPNPVGLEDLLFQETFDYGADERNLPWQCTITQCLSIKRTHFDQIGPFATDLLRGEDIEFGFRATQQNLLVRYLPRAVGRHNHALTMEQHSAAERHSYRHLVALFQRYPFLASEMRYLRHKWTIDWRVDPTSLIVRKMVRSVLVWRPVLWSMRQSWQVLTRTGFSPQALKTLYWWIVGSYQMLGLREGIRLYGPIPRDPGQGSARSLSRLAVEQP